MPANKARRESRQAFGFADLKRLSKEASKAAEAAKRKAAAAAAAQSDTRRQGTNQGGTPGHHDRPFLSDEDIQLFRRSMKTVAPIKDPQRAVMTLPPTASAEQLRQRRERATGQEAVRLQPTSDLYSPAKIDADGTRYLSAGYGPDILKSLKRGKWPITASIDLHGNTLEQARERLDRFLTTCMEHQIKCVRIVHGKGYGSKDGEPVLKQTVRRWLTQIAGVIAYIECAETEGGAGAVEVLLQTGTTPTLARIAMSWTYLAIAIAAEIVATTALKASDGFSRLYPALLTVAGYGLAFYCLSLALRTIPVGIAYAVWSGVGIVAISLIGYVLYRQTLDIAAWLGIGLIIAGVLVLNVFSKSATH